MKREIVMAKVASIDNRLCMALYEDGTCVELRIAQDYPLTDTREVIPEIGDIYIGRVEKVVSSINAAFVEIAKGVSCYYPLKEANTAIFTKKIGKQLLSEGEELLVQVHKEAVKTKQATVTSNLNFKGTYTVLTSGNTTLGVSGKIPKSKREALQEVLKPYVNDDCGLIARTNAAQVEVDLVKEEVMQLQKEFYDLKEKAQTRTAFTLMKKNAFSYVSFVEDICTKKIDKITIEDEAVYDAVRSFLKEKDIDIISNKVAPSIVINQSPTKDNLSTQQDNEVNGSISTKVSRENIHNACILKLYNDTSYPLEKLYSLETRISEGLHKKVWMKSGAYLIIEVTEALTVVDVNSGKAVNKKNAEESYLKINKEAALEVARQLRLRNISGIVLVDFINMKEEEHTKEVVSLLEKEVRKDRNATQVMGMTRLHLLEMTRKKTHKTLWESVKISNDSYSSEGK